MRAGTEKEKVREEGMCGGAEHRRKRGGAREGLCGGAEHRREREAAREQSP